MFRIPLGSLSPPAARRRVLRPRSRCSSTRAASADFCSFETKLSTSSNTWFRMSWGSERGTAWGTVWGTEPEDRTGGQSTDQSRGTQGCGVLAPHHPQNPQPRALISSQARPFPLLPAGSSYSSHRQPHPQKSDAPTPHQAPPPEAGTPHRRPRLHALAPPPSPRPAPPADWPGPAPGGPGPGRLGWRSLRSPPARVSGAPPPRGWAPPGVAPGPPPLC